MKDAEESPSRFFDLIKVEIEDTRDENGNLLSSVVMQETDKPKRISSGVINEPPPTPVKPMATPTAPPASM